MTDTPFNFYIVNFGDNLARETDTWIGPRILLHCFYKSRHIYNTIVIFNPLCDHANSCFLIFFKCT